jgi:hypothetical protein
MLKTIVIIQVLTVQEFLGSPSKTSKTLHSKIFKTFRLIKGLNQSMKPQTKGVDSRETSQ